MRVLALTRYGELGASSRVRIGQFRDVLLRHNIQLELSPLFPDRYVEKLYAHEERSLQQILTSYVSRLAKSLGPCRHDLVWIEKELFPFIPYSLEKWFTAANSPMILDYDDATFHTYDKHQKKIVRYLYGTKIDRLMRSAALVVAGNDYIASRASKAGANVKVLPDAVDVERYREVPRPNSEKPFTIGWIGTPITARYLDELTPVFNRIFADGGSLRVIGATGPAAPWVQSVRWEAGSEAAELSSCDVGIMPLPDAPWEKGKCGYKILQYFAAGLPVVASPVGVNRDIMIESHGGYCATSHDDWFTALFKLKTEPSSRLECGTQGKAWITKNRSVEIIGSQLAELFYQTVSTFHANGHN